jgi:DNA-binding transcriptional ArsR family regulator
MATMRSTVDGTLAALADPTRRRIVELLLRSPRRAGQLAEGTGATAPATSRHLRALLEGGLVEVGLDPTDARARVYRLRRAPFAALRRWLDPLQSVR